MNTAYNKKTTVVKNLLWSINKVKKFDIRYILLLVFRSILEGIMPLVPLLIMENIINLAQLKHSKFNNILMLAILLIFVEVINTILSNFVAFNIEKFELKYTQYIQSEILSKTARLDVKKFENSDIYNLIDRVQYDSEYGLLEYIKTLFDILKKMITIISFILIIYNYDIKIMIIIIIIPIIGYFYSKKYSLCEYELMKQNTEDDRKSHYIFFILTNSDTFKEIRSYSLSKFFIKKFNDIKYKINFSTINLKRKTLCSYTVINFFENIVDGFIIIKMLTQVYNNEILIGAFLLYNGALSSIKQNLLETFMQVASLYKNSSIVDQIILFFNLEEEVVLSDGIIITSIDKIELKNIYYKYEKSSDYVLKNININLKKGDKMAILGHNGSGKSTLIKILMGIYLDYEGSIYINNIDLKLINIESYRRLVSSLFQDYIRYESSLRNNICYGNIELLKSDKNEEIFNILKDVKLENLNKALYEKLGYQFDGGKQVSIGQWQKIAIARTLIRESDVYIFDELNASLDLKSERDILKSISDRVNSKISIFILHRFNKILKNAEKIIILEKGIILDEGTHEKLINKNDIYTELYNIQYEK
ncbi:ATP-binding cassette domain-containing protein [Peptostreptococcus faecalis]|uniref:ATP-binding cassette domain-containing protein n=1 Tax=Peptostreptococcus faecalis TaxID=2045015 RepID=UPI000C7CB808|nr:ABC transporter ATP-binding protein [Peptostreptococcus faecalis]